MHRIPTIAASAVAAALTALAVTVAVPALGAGGSPSPSKGDRAALKESVTAPGPTAAELRSCLRAHGATPPAGDDHALKVWLVAEGKSDSEKAALAACGFRMEDKKVGPHPCGEVVGPVPGKMAPDDRAKAAKATRERLDAS